jgi:NAD(P)-dependent dehydrogenase (short-subunit alcohol dehydrogenase family)
VFRNDLLKDKVILVTGGGTGLGLAMARRFGELGAKLVLASRSLDHLETAATELRGKGADVHVATCDVRKYDEVEAVVASSVAKFGRIDGLVNNAAGNFLAPTEDLAANAYASVVGIVLQGSFHATLAVGRRLIEQGTGGTILSILATYAAENVTGSAFVVPSACAKAGVLALTRSLAVEWARHKIRLNAIAPGAFPTEGAWSRLVPPGMEALVGLDVSKIPARRTGDHAELANLASYLMADGSNYMTGEVVTIDGGRSLMAGTFNDLTTLDPDTVIGAMRAMKPKK